MMHGLEATYTELR